MKGNALDSFSIKRFLLLLNFLKKRIMIRNLPLSLTVTLTLANTFICPESQTLWVAVQLIFGNIKEDRASKEDKEN